MPIDPKRIEEWRAAYLRVVGTMAESPDVARIVAEAFPALLAEREEMLALLRDIEWSGCISHDDGAVVEFAEGGCPSCKRPLRGMPHVVGHAPDCRLAAAIGRTL